jgi:hypothetical protein
VGRLNEALIVAYSQCRERTFRRSTGVVTIVRELDRYHGFAFADERATRRPSRLAPPSLAPLALEAPRAETEPNGAAND